ncbi:STAS domain-containing protein [Candidatus Sororendozoicomonas aggregata]|uniref:STAS domain-containing protein n=1 Tax=Candidatus Sororendozoicomonas aggregata TaxID=3073239 RepID=UPI002ED2301E
MAISISLEEHHNYLLLDVDGRIDALSALILKRAMDYVIHNSHKHLLLNFSQLEAINSDGLKVIYNSRQKLTFGRIMAVCHPSSAVRGLMALSGIDELMPIASDIMEGEMLLHDSELAQGLIPQQSLY